MTDVHTWCRRRRQRRPESAFGVELRDLARVQRLAVPEAEVGDGAVEIAIVCRPADPVPLARQAYRLLSIRNCVGECPVFVKLHGGAIDCRHDVHPDASLEEG